MMTRFLLFHQTQDTTSIANDGTLVRRTKPPLASPSSVVEPFNNKAVGGVNADHVESFVTDRGKAMRRRRPDYDYVGRRRQRPHPHRRPLPPDRTGRYKFQHRMLMQSRAFPWRKVAQKEATRRHRMARLRTRPWRLRLSADRH